MFDKPKIGFLAEYALKQYDNEYKKLNEYYALKDVMKYFDEKFKMLNIYKKFLLVRFEEINELSKSFVKTDSNVDNIIILDISTTKKGIKHFHDEIEKYIKATNENETSKRYACNFDYLHNIIFIKMMDDKKDFLMLGDALQFLNHI